MKINLSIQLACLLTLSIGSCKKSTTGPGSPTPNPVGSTGIITVTGISPLNPYPGDIITITGSGFDADKTKDTVKLGIYDSAITQSNGSHFYVSLLYPAPPSKIISATSTQIQFVNDSTGLNLPATFKFALRVSSPQKTGYTNNLISLRTLFTLYISGKTQIRILAALIPPFPVTRCSSPTARVYIPPLPLLSPGNRPISPRMAIIRVLPEAICLLIFSA